MSKSMQTMLAALLCVVVGLALAGPASAATGFERVGAFNQASPDGQPAHQHRIAVNQATGDIYATDPIGDQIVVSTPNGTGADPLTTFGSGVLTDPYGIAIDQSTGDVYVSDSDNIVKFTSDGAPTPAFTQDITFAGPTVTGSLAFDQANHQLLVADTGTNHVRRYSTAGVVVSDFDGTAGAGSPGAFTGLQDLAVDSTGDIVVVDATGNPARNEGSVSRVERFAANGDWEATIGPVEQAATVAIHPGDDEVIVSGHQNTVYSSGTPTVQVFASDGSSYGELAIDGNLPYATVTGIAADDGAEGHLYVATDNADYNNGPDQYTYGYVSVQVYRAFDLAPSVTTRPAVNVRTDRAELGGLVNAHGLPTTYYVEYGKTTAYGGVSPAGQNADAGSTMRLTLRARLVVGLTADTGYHYRVVARNAAGLVAGADATFTTKSTPSPDACPNADVRTQQGAQRLADCRAFEQVSPATKFGYPVAIDNRTGLQSPFNAGSRAGDAVVFVSWGSFADSTHSAGPQTYHAVRTPDGWITKPGSRAPTVASPNAGVSTGRALWSLATSDLTTGLVVTDNAWSPLDTNGSAAAPDARADVYVYDQDASHVTLVSVGGDGQVLGGVLNPYGTLNPATGYPEGLSADGRVVVFTTTVSGAPEDTAPGTRDVYEYRDGQTRLVSVAPGGGATVDATDGSVLPPSASEESNRSTVSEDASRIIFQSGPFDGFGVHGPLWMRIDGSQTRELSASQRTIPDPGGTQVPQFLRASPDGRYVVFSSPEALTDDAGLDGTNIYRYDVSTDALTLLVTQPDEAQVLGVSRDTARVWVLSMAKFTPDAVAGARNLYRFDGAVPTLVASALRTDSDPFPEDVLVDKFFVSTPSGNAIAFATRADLGFNSGGKRQLYRFMDGELRCASCPPAGTTPTSDVFMSTGSAIQTADKGTYGSSISDDGSRMAFQTADALAPTDTNNRDDVYLWQDGVASLVTSGRDATGSQIMGLSGDGRDLFFATAESLAPRDVDGSVDVYDARVDGGFLATGGASSTPCSGDACQERPTVQAPAPSAASVTFIGEGNLPDPRVGAPSPRVAAVKVSKVAAVRGTAATLKVKVAAAGAITVSGSGVATAKRQATKSATYSLRVALTAKARASLKKKKTLRVSVRVVFAPKVGKARSSTTVRLTFKQPTGRR